MEKKSVINVIKATMAQHDMLPPQANAPVVLMVSGGSDSVAAARILPQLLPGAHFTILHINHLLRGIDADKDELFVIHLAHELRLPYKVRRIDVAAQAAAQGDNLEQTGRQARYQAAQELLDTLCQEAGVDPAQGRIVTAHTLDDRVETFFMRALVGAGTGALASIPYKNGRVIRPLLDCQRAELQGFLRDEHRELPTAQDAPLWHEGQIVQGQPLSQNEQAKQDAPPWRVDETTQDAATQEDQVTQDAPLWREDQTNQDTSYLRAFVRHEVVPLLQSRNPQLLKTVTNSLDNLACDNRLLARMTDALEQRYVTYGAEAPTPLASINGAIFQEDQALIRRLILKVCQRLLPPGKSASAPHIINIAQNGHRVGFVTVIASAVTVANQYGTLVFSNQENPVPGTADVWNIPLMEGRMSPLPDGRVIELKRISPQAFRAIHPANQPDAQPACQSIECRAGLPSTPSTRPASPDTTSASPASPGDAASATSASLGTTPSTRPASLGTTQSTTCRTPASLPAPVAYAKQHAGATAIFIDADKVLQAGGVLRLGPVQPGDRFCPLGMGGHHRLVSDVLIDKKVPRRLRSSMCKVSVSADYAGTDCIGVDYAAANCAAADRAATKRAGAGNRSSKQDQIVWVIGAQMDERFKVCEKTREMLSIIVHTDQDHEMRTA